MAKLAMVTLVVRDYDEAIAYYVGKLGFALEEDTVMSPTKRWVVVNPGGGARLLLAKAANPAQQERVGTQTGGRVAFFLHVDDFEREYNRLRAQDVYFIDDPRQECYGRVVVFEDIYGNRWDLVAPK